MTPSAQLSLNHGVIMRLAIRRTTAELTTTGQAIERRIDGRSASVGPSLITHCWTPKVMLAANKAHSVQSCASGAKASRPSWRSDNRIVAAPKTPVRIDATMSVRFRDRATSVFSAVPCRQDLDHGA